MPKQTIFDKKNVLIIGGAGFVGSHLCDELVKKNKVICVDNFLTGDEENIRHLLQNPDFEFIKHDIVKPVNLEKAPSIKGFKLEFQGLQEIYFLASPTSPRAYEKYPIETMLVNSTGLTNALDLAVKYKSKLLYGSSSAVYGNAKGMTKESVVGAVDQLGERAVYAEAKRFGETLVNNYRQVHNINTKIVRIFNCYGPRMKLTDGRMIPEMILSAVNNGDIIIHGVKGSMGAYFYISDLVKALPKVMRSSESGPINLGSEGKDKFVDIAKKIINMVGATGSAIKFKEKEGVMADQILPDIRLAKEKLGWFPIVLLDEGLQKTIDHMQAQKNILDPEEIIKQ